MRLLEEKAIFITGGTSGIGAATVQAALDHGALVGISDIKISDEFKQRFPSVQCYPADVTSAKEMEAVCDQFVDHFGRMDGAVNSAGIALDSGGVLETSLADWELVHKVNVDGIFYSMLGEIKHMLAHGRGSIVNLASLAGVTGERGVAPYISSKHAVVGITKSASSDYARQGIRTNAVCPSFVKTPMTEHLFEDERFKQGVEKRQPMGRVVEAYEVANIIVFLLSDLSSAMTGAVHLADGGLRC
jgi:NAD(P)-dependent dehydrogenase (short-subunit alcohol dehydrogenase family)